MNSLHLLKGAWTVVAAAGLAVALGATPAQSGVDCEDPKFIDHKQCAGDTGGGGAGGGESGKSTPIIAEIIAGPSLSDDGRGPYFNKDGGVKAFIGGDTQPNRPGINVELRGTGNNPRLVEVDVGCSNPDLGGGIIIGGAGGCDFLDGIDPVFGVLRAKMGVRARPYEVNCPPGLLIDGQCPDVFTMGETSALMSFRTKSFEDQILLEIASDIGGADSLTPGRCLSLLSDDDRDAFLDIYCGSPGGCNVTVTALDTSGDDRNDAWDIEAANDTGLICRLGSGEQIVIGVATGVSFTIEVDADL